VAAHAGLAEHKAAGYVQFARFMAVC